MAVSRTSTYMPQKLHYNPATGGKDKWISLTWMKEWMPWYIRFNVLMTFSSDRKEGVDQNLPWKYHSGDSPVWLRRNLFQDSGLLRSILETFESETNVLPTKLRPLGIKYTIYVLRIRYKNLIHITNNCNTRILCKNNCFWYKNVKKNLQ